MRQPFSFEQGDLEELATKADDLYTWIEDEQVRSTVQKAGGRMRIPTQLTILTTATLMYATVFLDQGIPDAMCWMGGCVA